jgi:hypothetical protein
MEKILSKQLPTRSEALALEKAFGRSVADKIESMVGSQLSVSEWITDLANLPRAMQASFDLSAPIRQGNYGLKAGYADEWSDAFKAMIKAARSDDYVDAIDAAGTIGTRAALYKESDMYLAGLSRLEKLSAREEAFMSTLAERIPVFGRGVKWSEKTYGAFLNQFRMNIFDNVINQWASEGRKLTSTDYKSLGNYINHVTGRGDIKDATKVVRGLFGDGVKVGDTIHPGANAVLYSPRFLLSKIQVHTDLFATDSNLVRKLVARDLYNYYRTNVGILRQAKLAGDSAGWEVEDDPLSTDFGKIKVGNTRFDVWGPTAPMMRLIARLDSGVSKNTVSGEIQEISKSEITARYFRSKLSPGAGLAVDLVTGSTFIGNDVDVTDMSSLGEIAYEKSVPLVAQDIIDVIRNGDVGITGTIAAGSAFFGQGVSAYEASPYQKSYLKKESLSQELFGSKQADLSPEDRFSLAEISSYDPEIILLEREGVFERSDDMGEHTARQERASEKQIKNMLSKSSNATIDSVKAGIRGVSKRLNIDGGYIKMTDKEFRGYKKIIARNIESELADISVSEDPDINSMYMDAEIVDEAIKQAIKLSSQEMLIVLFDEHDRKARKINSPD